MSGANALPVAKSDGGTKTRSRRRLFILPVVAFTTATMVVMGAGSASAVSDPDPIGTLTTTVQKTLSKVTKATQPAPKKSSRPSRGAPNPPAVDSDSPGHETANPRSPDHGSSYVGHAVAGGQTLADVAKGRSTVKDNDRTSANSTLLAIAGTEIIGSHARSDGANESHGAFPAIPLCDATKGAICLDLLYSDSFATDNGSSSDASTHNGVANACLFGDDATGTTCSGLRTGVLTSNSSAHRNQKTGRTTTSADSSAASVCVAGDLPGCTLGADALTSDGHADSNGPAASRHSGVLNLGIGGTTVPVLQNDPFAVSLLLPDCASPSVVCVFGNQGETYLGDQLAGTSQSALDIFALDRNLRVGLAHSETLAHNSGGRDTNPPTSTQDPPTKSTKASNASSTDQADPVINDGVLPRTGGVWSGLLGIGLLLVGAGAMALAWTRRRAIA